MPRRSIIVLLLLYLVAGLFVSGAWALAPMAVLSSAIGLYLIHQVSPLRGYLLLLLATFVALLLSWRGLAPVPMPIYPVFMLVNAAIGCLAFVLDRILRPRLGGRLAGTLVFPVAATAVEFLSVGSGPLGSFGATAYAFADSLALSQLSALTGILGLTFLAAWLASILAWALQRVRADRPYRHGALAGVAVLALLLAAGSWRLGAASPASSSVPVAGITADHTEMAAMMATFGEDRAAFIEQTRRRHQAYLRMTREAAGGGAKLVLWPELAGLGLAEDVDQLLADGAALAAELDIYLAMPVFVVSEDEAAPSVNKIVMADSKGELVLEHVKYGGNLLERTLPGPRELQSVDTPYGRMSAVICWDTDFPAVVRQAGQDGVDLLLSPAYVWPEVAELHAEMAAFRAIENGLSILRHSDDGYSVVIDPYGRVVKRANQIGSDEAFFVAEVPIGRVETLYPAVGDILGTVSVAGLLAMLALAGWRRFGRRGKGRGA